MIREDGVAEGRAGVDLLAEGDELDPEVPEQLQAFAKVADRAAETVESRDDHDVDAPGLRCAREAVGAGRFSRVPETPWSTNSTACQPRAATYSRRSRSCESQLCSAALTRA